jgi:hypothetical protein
MSNSTTYTPGTTVTSGWLNDVNTGIYSGNSNIPGSTAQSLLTILARKVSVMDFGAKGDGTTDDTTAIQNAINYVESTYNPAGGSNSPAGGACSLFFPAGYYKITATLNVTQKVAFQGEGPSEFSSGSRLVMFTAGTDLIKVVPVAAGCSISFENLTLLSNTNGGGSLIHVTRGTGGSTCNSQRYYSCVFGTPQIIGLNIEAGDDIIVDNCLWDVSAVTAVALGTTTNLDVVSNITFKSCRWFSVATRCILVNNVANLSIIDPKVYSTGSSRTNYLVDAATLTPYQVRGVSIIGGQLGMNTIGGGGTPNTSGVDCLIKAYNIQGLKIDAITAINFGAGGAAILNGIELSGSACNDISITCNDLNGNFGTKNVYNDTATTVTNASITGNTIVNNSGTGQALSCANTTGTIASNAIIGFTSHSVSEQVFTSGATMNPGTVTTLNHTPVAIAMSGVRQGDKVSIIPSSTTWFVPVGIETVGFSTVGNANVDYRNFTGGSIVISAHDIGYLVSRGA